MKNIDLNQWILAGDGATANSYYNKDDDSIMLKLYTLENGEELANLDYSCSVKVEKLGVSTPKVFEIVKYENTYGIIFEKVKNKKSFGKLCQDNPENIPYYARLFAKESKKLHSISCDTKAFPSRKETYRLDMEKICLKDNIKAFMYELLDKAEDVTTCLHGDLQTGNMVMGWCDYYEGRKKKDGEDNKCYFIDLGSFCYGDPAFDISELYLCTKIFQNEKRNIDLLHLEPDQATLFWDCYIEEYLDTKDKKIIDDFERKIRPYAAFFFMGILIASDKNETLTKMVMDNIDKLYFEYLQNN